MRYMLDTNICSYVLKNRPPEVKWHFDQVGADALVVSTVVLAELYYGAARHPAGKVIRREIDDFSARLAVLPWDEAAADHYGDIRSAMERNGTPIGAMDMMIAAHARSQSCALVSNDVGHFARVPDLLTVNWAQGRP
ncbi:MAG: type II toxin-antitoxin system VapC family toxin [Thermodesulfobacteriota bacterium]